MTVIDFTMPSLGADMDSGTITEWMIDVGDSVSRGDVVAIVETDKADIDIEIWDTGVVADIVVPVGETVAVGTPLARIECAADEAVSDGPGADEAVSDGPGADEAASDGAGADEPPSGNSADRGSTPGTASADGPVAATEPDARSAPISTATRAARPASDGKLLASPLVRRLAAERGIELASINGSGPGGAVIARDLSREKPVAAADMAPPPSPAPATSAAPAKDPAVRMRQAIADLMARSKREIPHYYLQTEVDLEAALDWLESYNSDRAMDERILPAALIMKAIAIAVADHPEFNGLWVDGGLRPGNGVHLGMAVSLRGGGLVAPAIRHADRLTVSELMTALRDVVGRARSGRLRASEMTDPTLTVTNLGDRGVEVVHGVIYPPQVALIGVGKIVTRPAVIDDEIVPRRQVSVTLAADHRASDGQRGARLLTTISRLLQKPEDL